MIQGNFEPVPGPALAAPPTNLTGTPTQSSVALTWDASTDTSVTGYQVKVTPPAGQTVATPPVSSIARQTISGLTAGSSYTFTVSAVNATGVGAESAPFTVTLPAATDRITIGTASWKAGDFKVVGTGSQLNATITLFRVNADGSRGTAITGAVTNVVAAAPPGIGDWTIRLRNGQPTTNPGRIMAVSSGGGTTAPFTVANK